MAKTSTGVFGAGPHVRQDNGRSVGYTSVMNDLRIILFEDPAVVYLLCAMVAAVAAVAAMGLRKRWVWWGVVAPAAVAVGAGLLASAVTTDREHLSASVGALVEAAVAGDAAALAGWIADDYDDGVYDKAAVLDRLGEVRRQWGLQEADLSQVEINITGDGAVVALRAVVRFERSASLYDIRSAPTRWQLWWSRRAGRWRLTSSRLLDPGGVPGAPTGP